MNETPQWHVGWVLEINAPETDRWQLFDHIDAANVTDLRGRPPTTVARERGMFRIPAWARPGDESQPIWLMHLLRVLTETHGYQGRVVYDPWPREDLPEAPATTNDIVTDMRTAEQLIRDQHRVSHANWRFWREVADWLNEMASDAEHGIRPNYSSINGAAAAARAYIHAGMIDG